jgi:hypothetical protein
MTTMQGGERLVLAGTRALAVTITEVPELSPGTIGTSPWLFFDDRRTRLARSR